MINHFFRFLADRWRVILKGEQRDYINAVNINVRILYMYCLCSTVCAYTIDPTVAFLFMFVTLFCLRNKSRNMVEKFGPLGNCPKTLLV